MQHNSNSIVTALSGLFSRRSGNTSRLSAVALLACALALAGGFVPVTGQAQSGTPTVNGLFYGDGDNDRYPSQPFAVSDNGSRLHLTLINNTLYVALVVDRSVNDNVFDTRRTTYMESAGWNVGGGNLTALRRMDSEFAEFSFTVGSDGTEQTFNWQQGYAGQPDGNHDRTTANYISDETVAGGLGTPPPGMVSASSMMWNLNTYADQLAAGTLNWAMPGTDTDANSWKSPWRGADGSGSPAEDPNTVIDANEGWPSTGQITFSETYQWEWSMIYEWSVDMSQFGETPVFVVTGSSHHSPSKTGNEDDPFTVTDPQPLSDYDDLPDLYGTLRASNGAQHVIDTGSTLQMGDNIDSEADGQPGDLATGDDTTSVNDDDGVTFPAGTTTSDGSTFVYESTVTATNSSTNDALICGWFDFANDGVLDNTPNTSTTAADPDSGSATDAGERSCVLVPAGTSNGTFQVAWTIPGSAQDNSGLLPFRYRLSSDPDMFASATLSPVGAYNNGEVEGYLIDFGANSLPVSISSFKSRYTDQGLELTWATVSETHNLGFHIWGDRGNGLEQLSTELIPAEDGDPVTPRAYTLVIPDVAKGQVRDLAVTAVDYRGDEEVYGLFDAGKNYGQEVTPTPIPWQEVRQQAKFRAQLHAAERKRAASVQSRGSNAASQADYIDVRVTEPGLQEISWQMLADAGMDLNGVAATDIAVTLKGEPVSRHVVDANPRSVHSALRAAGRASERGLRFGPGGKIRFWGKAPSYPDALYVEHYVYRVSVAPAKALGAAQSYGQSGETLDWHMDWQRQNEDNQYNFGNPLEDPWFAARLRDNRANEKRYETTFEVDDQLLGNRPGHLKIVLGGLTDFDIAPDHHATVDINGNMVGEVMFDGRETVVLDLEVPAGVLTPGTNLIGVNAPGGTAARFDLFVLDTIDFGYPRALVARDNRLLVEAPKPGSVLRAEGFTGDETVAYAYDGETLTHLQQTTRGGTLQVQTIDANAHYWLSSADRIARPAINGQGNQTNLLAGASPDFLIIAHPAFLPVSERESHPLNTYLAQRRSEGWTPRTFDVTAIQAQYGHGMPLPDAVTAFLAAADERFDYQHVLLVGGDSYDYQDKLGKGGISFIPTRYAATKWIPHTPSDALLTDLDGDGLGDKAIGRWPVRTEGDLQAIVAKTLEWPTIDNPASAIWVTDSEDSRSGSFQAQAERMIAPLLDAGWDESRIDRVYFADVQQQPGASRADSARMELFDQLEKGRALTGFVGHGSPSMWTFQGLLTPDDLKHLYNEGNPTLIGTLTCYTSYFVSPESDTVAHRWMNGYRENSSGARIEGVANGAVAIHGAATLSSYRDNETFARNVQNLQLAGETIGNAVQATRREAERKGMSDHVINWTLLGDPTLILQR